jgi:polysaccharide biosynthesis protein PslH
VRGPINNGRSLRELAVRVLDRWGRRRDASVPNNRHGPLFERRTREVGGQRTISVQVLFVQYDRKKYEGAFERLLGLLDALSGIDYSLLVVDNLEPGEWSHPISSLVVHAGGDNSAWEFSAFDRGLRQLERDGSRRSRDLYLFVTDAYAAYGDEFLALIDRGVFERALSSGACLGWVDSWPDEFDVFGHRVREWLRTSFLVVPADVLPRLRPFATPIDRGRLFSTDPREPFLAKAPISTNLKEYLVHWLARGEPRHPLERWHSHFELDKSSFGFFMDKVCAILREYLLSARIREAGVPSYDFRLLDLLARRGADWEGIDAKTLESFAWGGWHAAAEIDLPSLSRVHVESRQIPDVIDHGQVLPLHVEGWVLAAQPPDWVQVRASTGHVAHGVANRPREDVQRVHPRYAGVARGFVIEGALRGLTPGEHQLELVLGGGQPPTPLKSVRVVPAREFRPRRVNLPDTWPLGKRMLISIEGEFCSSLAAQGVTALLDGEALESRVFLGPGERDESGLWTYDLALHSELTASELGKEHSLELEFAIADGTRHVWRRRFAVGSRAQIAHSLRRIGIGPYRPDLGLTDLKLEVEIFEAEPGDHLLLLRKGSQVFDVPLSVNKRAGANTARPTLVAVEHEVEGIPPGLAQFALAVRRQKRTLTLWQGDWLVRLERPEITLEVLETSFVPGVGRYAHRLSVRGWVKNHFFVDCIVVEVDSSRAAVIAIDALRPDVAEAFQEPLVSSQGFDATVDIQDVSPGEHLVHLIACQRGGEAARLSRRVTFADSPTGYASIVSADLDGLLRGHRGHQYGSIALHGTIETRMNDLVATLIVDGRRADEQRFETRGRHALALRTIPDTSGERGVRVVVSRNGRAVYETPPRRVHFQRFEPPEAPVRALGKFLTHFDLRDKFVGLSHDRDLLCRLIEGQPERIAEFFELLGAIEERLVREPPRSKKPERSRSMPPERPLRVLLASWESPHHFHGGGVYLCNLIERLGARHELSVIHTQGIDEVGLADGLRGSTKKLIGVLRQHRNALFRADACLPQHFYDIYTPELRRTIELEVQTGNYDVVDYHYTALGPYVASGTPRVLTVHELGYTALLNTHFTEARPVDSLVPALERLLRTFHYNVVELPRISPNLIALTDDDAAGIADYSPEARVFVNRPGVDAQSFRPPRDAEARSGPPTFVYVGNYRHPPNVVAARFFAEEVMPLLLRRQPEARFRLVGSNMVQEVMELDGKNNVTVVGLVQDVRPELWHASACVAPIFTGTGMRLKVLEALASGTPLIATKLAVRGLSLAHGKHFLEAASAAEFADAAARLIGDPSQARAIGREGRKLVEREHDWEQAARQRESVWQFAAREARSRRVG